jgi:hypothetical protein
MASPTILRREILESPTRGEDIAVALVGLTKTGATPLEGFQIMLRSASSARAAEIGREQIEEHYQKTLSEALRGELAPQRAALVLAIVAGFQVMRQMIGLSALANAEPAALIRILAPVFEQLAKPESGLAPAK